MDMKVMFGSWKVLRKESKHGKNTIFLSLVVLYKISKKIKYN